MNIETLAIHAGQAIDPQTGAVMTPIYQTSTFAQKNPGQDPYMYSRAGNPTRKALEECLAALEGAKHGLAFASGMSATDAALRLLLPGDHVVTSDDVYGGTFRIFTQVYQPYGITFSFVDIGDVEAVRAAIQPNTRIVWIESPSNPKMKIADIRALTELAHATPYQAATGTSPSAPGASPVVAEGRRLVVVDNTFASPFLQQPLALGADITMHSTTKYIGGHSDVIGGALMTNDKPLYDRLYLLQRACGAVPGPMDCFLLLRGIKTLPVRMERHCQNAAKIAQLLDDHPEVEAVYYPGLPSHPNHEVAKRQMKDFGGMISFIVKGGAEAAKRVALSTKLWTFAVSLGGVESLIEVPTLLTHAVTATSSLAVNPALLRLSVGLEDVEDLWMDLRQALES
ncbi:MAG: cystathionine gamma-synthase [Caldilineaceae bacterium]